MDLNAIATGIVQAVNQDVEVREVGGNNRGVEIDLWNTKIGVPLGSSYCVSGVQYRLRQLASLLDLKLLLPYCAGSQQLWWETAKDFKVQTPAIGRLCVFFDKSDPGHGHLAVCTGGLNADGITFPTIEYNSNSKGSNDGEGVVRGLRSVLGSATMEIRGFIDLPRMFVAP